MVEASNNVEKSKDEMRAVKAEVDALQARIDAINNDQVPEDPSATIDDGADLPSFPDLSDDEEELEDEIDIAEDLIADEDELDIEGNGLDDLDDIDLLDDEFLGLMSSRGRKLASNDASTANGVASFYKGERIESASPSASDIASTMFGSSDLAI
jgi:hypothetical protein